MVSVSAFPEKYPLHVNIYTINPHLLLIIRCRFCNFKCFIPRNSLIFRQSLFGTPRASSLRFYTHYRHTVGVGASTTHYASPNACMICRLCRLFYKLCSIFFRFSDFFRFSLHAYITLMVEPFLPASKLHSAYTTIYAKQKWDGLGVACALFCAEDDPLCPSHTQKMGRETRPLRFNTPYRRTVGEGSPLPNLLTLIQFFTGCNKPCQRCNH